MSFVGSIQVYLFLAIALVGLGLEVWALVDAARHKSGTYTAAGKLTKGKWVAILVAAVVIGFLGIPAPIGVGLPIILTLAAIVPAGVYLADVRPALRQYGGGGGRRPPRGW
ncbi:putative integral membrane protein [Beutenbergia cavernae DSM 12333]|uniref:Putative integral membrane protein n=1 Tax=Beutenbergia cavernae (strain ATCC BAA-8 / DSM 12333 / CCUG 43141 / JCM 11478 / NBRC 16432 / NCIMB 13614 / HKI 0122) TaxID=471853 RepID=C5C228_BEUC1|nr:DUF2516 family protein [Beutenbergia cavernae]ACQ81653.1 putative integral membrane protein [Beutenbergia cavernae DSM 12333]